MKKFYALLILSIMTIGAYCQSSEVITDILNTDKVTYGQICYLSVVYQGLDTETVSYSEAVEILYNKGQIPSVIFEETPIPLANISYVFAQMWNIKGGAMYRLFRGAPRYAYKQLKTDGVLPDNSDPSQIISGQTALNIFTTCSLKYDNLILSAQ